MSLDEELIVKPLTLKAEGNVQNIAKKKKWNGTWPAHCNRCGIGLDKVKVFYDSATVNGPWGLFCHSCWQIVSYLKLGTGLGQKYDSKTLEKLEV